MYQKHVLIIVALVISVIIGTLVITATDGTNLEKSTITETHKPAGQDTSSHVDSVDMLEHALGWCEGFDPTKKYVDDLRIKLSMFKGALQYVSDRSKGLDIDVVFQEHASLANDSYQPKEENVLLSQGRIFNLLCKQNYDVVADEGSPLEPLTFETSVEAVVRYAVKHGQTSIDREKIRQVIRENLPIDAGLHYATEYPNKIVIGSEDESLNALHALILTNQEDLVNLLGQQKYDGLNAVLSITRSDIAIAKLVVKLRKEHKTRGAIIIGAAHYSRMKEIITRLGVASTFYWMVPDDTIPGDIKT